MSNSGAIFHKLNNHKAFWIFVFVLLLVQMLDFPHNAYHVGLDSSSEAMFEYCSMKKMQFGSDTYHNVGPFGFIHYIHDYAGYYHWQKVLLKNASRIGLVVLICWLIGNLKQTQARLLCFVSFFLFYPFGDASNNDYIDLIDNLAYVTIYLLALWLLQNRADRRFHILSLISLFFLAFLSLNKLTFFVIASVAVIAVFAQNCYWRKYLRAGGWVGFFLAALALNWVLAGQSIKNLPGFIYGIFVFSSGYNDAMSLPTPIVPLLLGISVGGLFSMCIIHHWWQDKTVFGRRIVELFILFSLWKHGFVRADEHMLNFFYTALLLVIPFFYYRSSHNSQHREKTTPEISRITTYSSALILLCCLVAFYGVIYHCHYKPLRLWNHFCFNISWLLSPLEKTSELELDLIKSKETYTLPTVKKIVGQASIDFFGREPGYLLLNNLNWSLRPMPMSFTAMNYYLQKANERFYRDPLKAPAYILYQSGSIDDRLFLQDDALAKAAIQDHYKPILSERGLLLLQRRDMPSMPPRLTDEKLTEQEVAFNEFINLKSINRRPVWLEVTIEHTLLGKLLAFLYKPRPCYIGLQFAGEKEPHFRRFVITMGNCGFLVNPNLEDTSDFARYYDSSQPIESFQNVQKLLFRHGRFDTFFFKDRIRLHWRLPDRPKA